MLAPAGTSLRRKWFTLSVLGLAGLATFGLAGEVGLQESNLPNDIRLDELRLLEPQRFNYPTVNEGANSFQTAETRLRSFNQCLQAKFSDGNSNCLIILEGLLRTNPANGRLWLEVARLRSRDANGLNNDALSALQHSFDYAPREGWITRVRTSFVLSVWRGLSPELQRTATAEILEALSDDKFVVYLSDIYEANPISRFALSDVIAKAPLGAQRNFLLQLERHLNN